MDSNTQIKELQILFANFFEKPAILAVIEKKKILNTRNISNSLAMLSNSSDSEFLSKLVDELTQFEILVRERVLPSISRELTAPIKKKNIESEDEYVYRRMLSHIFPYNLDLLKLLNSYLRESLIADKITA